MNPVNQMHRVLTKKTTPPRNGTVHSIDNGKLSIRTSKGAILTVAAGPGEYAVGDRVQLQNGIVVQKMSTTAGKIVYLV